MPLKANPSSDKGIWVNGFTPVLALIPGFLLLGGVCFFHYVYPKKKEIMFSDPLYMLSFIFSLGLWLALWL